LATALWQTALEFTIFCPLDLSTDNAIADFEDYWDSESYRLGESLNSGWRSGSMPEPFSYQTATVSPGRSIFAQFVQVELNSEVSLHIPGRTIDDAGEDDPFHVILFSDISPFLSVLLTSPEIVPHLIYAFLCFAGLPPLEGHNETIDYGEWWLDPFLRSQAVDLWDKLSGSTERVQYLPVCWRWSRMTTDILFSSAFPDNINTNILWTQTVLKQLTYSQNGWNELAEYLIAFLLKYSSPE
jgi:NRDE-2, necessary for RNA interference